MAKQYPYDYDSVDPIYPAKTGLYAYTQEAVLQRGVVARKWLKARSEKVIAVVTHAAFLRTSVAHARFANADYRIFKFPSEDDGDEMVESESTEARGGGMGRSGKGRMEIEEGDFRNAEEELADRPQQ